MIVTDVAQRDVIVSIQQSIDGDVEASRYASMNLNTSLALLESNLVAQENAVNRTLSTLVADFDAFSDAVRERLGRTPDFLAAENLPRAAGSRLAATMDDLRRLGADFRRELDSLGAEERSAWQRLIADELTRSFYESLRSDVAGFSVRQLREFAEYSPGGNAAAAAAPSGEWSRNYEFELEPPSGATGGAEVRYALVNADIPSIDPATVSDQLTFDLSGYADRVDVERALKVKVEDLLTKFDEVSGSVESLKSDCRPPDDDDVQRLIR